MSLDADTTITGGAYALTFDHASVSSDLEVTGRTFMSDASVSADFEVGGVLKVSSISGNTLLTIRPGADADDAIKIQKADGSATIMRVDTSNNYVAIGNNLTAAPTNPLQIAGTTPSLRVGDASNAVVITNANNEGIRFKGTARNIKTVTLWPEFAGALMTGNAANSSGTMISDNEASVSFRSYYQWSATSATTQEYKIFVRIPVPSDFTEFRASESFTVGGYTDTDDSSILVSVRDSNNSADARVASSSIATSVGNWTITGLSPVSSGFTAGEDALLILEMLASSSSKVRLGSISFEYLSEF
jgi:hypothetical protein